MSGGIPPLVLQWCVVKTGALKLERDSVFVCVCERESERVSERERENVKNKKSTILLCLRCQKLHFATQIYSEIN